MLVRLQGEPASAEFIVIAVRNGEVDLYGGRTQEAAYRTVFENRISATIRVPKTPHGKGKGLKSDAESS